MPSIELSTSIAAPIDRVFDLFCSIDAHVFAAKKTNEVPVSGRTSGLIGLGEEVEWEATHLGVRQRLSVRITGFNRPYYFQDTMLKGAFSRMHHDHYLSEVDGRTVVRDIFKYKAPLGPLGKLAERLFLTRHMRQFLEERNLTLKSLAESEEWKTYLNQEDYK